jgi:hypothetical protein
MLRCHPSTPDVLRKQGSSGEVPYACPCTSASLYPCTRSSQLMSPFVIVFHQGEFPTPALAHPPSTTALDRKSNHDDLDPVCASMLHARVPYRHRECSSSSYIGYTPPLVAAVASRINFEYGNPHRKTKRNDAMRRGQANLNACGKSM